MPHPHIKYAPFISYFMILYTEVENSYPVITYTEVTVDIIGWEAEHINLKFYVINYMKITIQILLLKTVDEL